MILGVMGSCASNKKAPENNSTMHSSVQAKAPQIIYKTNKDYSRNVPIFMNKEKTKITGFPAPSDLIVNGELQTPLKLDNNFLYDRRGVSLNTVYIKMTFEDYSKLEKAPSNLDLMNMIIEKNPMVELYSCPQLKPGEDVEKLNKLVNSGFPECVKISNIK